MSVLRVANAVGIGLGGLLGGAIVAGGGLSEYRVLFIVSSLAILSASILVWRMVPAIVLPSRNSDGKHGSWGDVLPDRLFLYTQGVLFVLIFGFTQLTMTVPAFLRQEAGIGEGTIGLLFTINTALVILTQIPITARVNRGNVGRFLAVGALFWALSFLVMLATPSFGVPAAVLVFLAFTAGELLFMPVTAVIPIRLAPVHLRGRYFAFASIMWGASYAVASFFGGLALDLPEPALLWPVMLGIMLLGGLGALRFQSAPRLAVAPTDPQPEATDAEAGSDLPSVAAHA
jgi:MFS family permease